MTVPDIIIAVDGYSSTGKSSLAKQIARSLGFTYLDSGALYRGVTLFAQREGYISPDNTVSDSLQAALDSLQLFFGEGNHCFMDGEDVEEQIRSMSVSSQVSPIAAVPYVREWVDCRLHSLSSSGRVVMDGRDIGTTVFPNAEVKIFMTASDSVRAKRRYDELVSKGQKADLTEVLENLRQRDWIDSHRETSPLRRAEDAFVLDNSEMTMEEELCWVRGLIQGKFGILE